MELGDIDGVQVVSQAYDGGEVGEALGDDGAKDGRGDGGVTDEGAVVCDCVCQYGVSEM